MGALFIVFAISMGFATFAENDYGAAVARDLVYNAKWFEAVMVLLAINMTGQIFIYKLYRRSKITVFMFHAAFVVMILGAGITRYFGTEGMMHIREGESKNFFTTESKYLDFEVSRNGNTIEKVERPYNITSMKLDGFSATISDGNTSHYVELAEFIPNATESIANDPTGVPMGSFLVTSSTGMREVLLLKAGEVKNAGGMKLSFIGEAGDFNISMEEGTFFVTSPDEIVVMNMRSQETQNIMPDTRVALEPMVLYNLNDFRIVPQSLSPSGRITPVAVRTESGRTGQNALVFNLRSGTDVRTLYVWDNTSDERSSSSFTVDGAEISLSYGHKRVDLPFEIKLNDFILDRYPGSNSPSGYKSDVTLIDREKGIEAPHQIYMNNILKHRGFRFYQSSYDQDELGTVLSVNMDFAGMMVTYFGYGMLFLFIILSIFNPKSLFRSVNASYWSSPLRKTILTIVLVVGTAFAGNLKAQKLVVDPSAADKFGTVLVQDQKGRTEPLFTLSNDILRKTYRSDNFEGINPMQVYLGFYFDFRNWSNVKLIRVSNKDLQKAIGIRTGYASFNDIVTTAELGGYKLSRMVDAAYSKDPSERSKFDKEVIKLDERVNIIYMITLGEFMNIFPMGDGSTKWGNSKTALPYARNPQDSTFIATVLPAYGDALIAGNNEVAGQYAEAIKTYQTRFANYELASEGKRKAEILYFKLGIFERLFPFYATLGLILFVALVWAVIKGKKERNTFVKVVSWIIFSGVVVHTFGLALRWYVSGHSPMSNGYESMIFISWVTLVAGVVFSRRSPFALSATAVLGAMTLMVAHLSFMDPEITNLVPVLQSYWLTLHVSVITGSYGFLGLGAILGLVVMILMALSGKSNLKRVEATITELTVINFKAITLGLYLLTIGTFLGAVWANESWGRYWGWDPKETWSLITVIIYSLVIHLRMIPGMKSIYTYNVLSLAAFSSVLMTYFGVNYYLSGLHSYAGGDPIPVPPFVYIAVVTLAAVSVIAWFKYKKWSADPKK